MCEPFYTLVQQICGDNQNNNDVSDKVNDKSTKLGRKLAEMILF